MCRRLLARVVPAPAALVVLVLGGCSIAPEPVTEQGGVIDRLLTPVTVAAAVVAGLVWALVAWSIVRYRRRNDTLPPQVAEHVPIEIAYTVIPIVIVAVLFAFGTGALTRVEEKVADPDVVVEIQGFQWSWQFTYPGEGVVVAGDGTGTTGPELVLPVDRTTRLELVSADVAHSFWVPDFLSKRDLVPGVDNEVDVTPTEEGTFVGRCAEYCGLDHWRMNFTVRIVSAREFAAWAEASATGPEGPARPAGPDEGEGGG
ncbi:MAG TPA: cytochrome c oxidase subunit II [Acidimicrobiales bacterium]|nr:cytochrome c oxidase subunit II [Acidimicrobiales bacterium]